MTAKPKKQKQPAPPPPEKSGGQPMKPWLKDLIACALIYLAIVFMFHEVILGGKIIASGDDTTNSIVLNQYAAREAEVRDYPLWCPEMYGGFPSFAAGGYSTYEHMDAPYSLAYRWFSPRYWVDVITIKGLLFGGEMGSDTGGSSWMIALMIYGGLLTYLLLRRLGLSVLIALFAGLAFAWNPYLFSIITATHGGKLMTFIYMPLIVMVTWNLLQHRRLFDMALLALIFGWQIAVGGHTQILFYSGLTILFICAVWAFFEFREHGFGNVGLAAGLVIIAVVLAVAVGSLWYIPLMTYVDYSIRGAGPALEAAHTGYSMDQATMWSMMPSELITFVVPSWYGLKAPYYWGGMPFTSSSFYFGILPLLFGILALFAQKTRLMWGLIVLSGFSILLSFGRHFELFYGIFFNYFPLFNKFRTPSLILLLLVLSGIILSGYGIKFVLDLRDNEKWRKVFLYGAGIAAAILVISLIGGESILGIFASGVKEGETARYSAQQITQIRDIRLGMLQKDLALSMLWLALGFAACWAYVSRKLTANYFIAGLIVILVIDLGLFSSQFFETRQPGAQMAPLQPNNVVRWLQQNDKSIYRVYPLGQLNQDNRWVYWEIDSFGGYHGAKMRSWQDVQDYVIPSGPNQRFPLHMSFLSSMNCKYLVSSQILPSWTGLDSVTADPAAGMILYRNKRALDRVFYVDSVIVAPTREETFRTMQNPAIEYDYIAVIDAPLPGPIKRDPVRSARITRYTPHEVTINAKNAVPAFLVLSDAYYAPGWTAMVDGVPSKIYQVDGFVRGLYLQPGDHSIIYRYTGKDEKRGELVATFSYFLVLLLLGGGWWLDRKRRTGQDLA